MYSFVTCVMAHHIHFVTSLEHKDVLELEIIMYCILFICRVSTMQIVQMIVLLRFSIRYSRPYYDYILLWFSFFSCYFDKSNNQIHLQSASAQTGKTWFHILSFKMKQSHPHVVLIFFKTLHPRTTCTALRSCVTVVPQYKQLHIPKKFDFNFKVHFNSFIPFC